VQGPGYPLLPLRLCSPKLRSSEGELCSPKLRSSEGELCSPPEVSGAAQQRSLPADALACVWGGRGCVGNDMFNCATLSSTPLRLILNQGP